MNQQRRLYDQDSEELIPLPDDPTDLRARIAARDAEISALRAQVQDQRDRALMALNDTPKGAGSLAGARKQRRALAKALEAEKARRQALELELKKLRAAPLGFVGRLLGMVK